jgi:hypothetical protein
MVNHSLSTATTNPQLPEHAAPDLLGHRSYKDLQLSGPTELFRRLPSFDLHSSRNNGVLFICSPNDTSSSSSLSRAILRTKLKGCCRHVVAAGKQADDDVSLEACVALADEQATDGLLRL